MPSWSKLEFFQFVIAWAGHNYPCKREFDNEFENRTNFSDSGVIENGIEIEIEDVIKEMNKLGIQKYKGRGPGAHANSMNL
ncbi:hypothetical protein SO802_018359 [Lithocarpus litseifolius]|uniref:Uncharacterized protein n=1 Tax=Lithocarpus litseifolius TaxID=425828 RepID=A0AAW2CM60_9ROSI